MSESRLVELAKTILDNAILFQTHFQENGLGEPSLDEASFPEPELPLNIQSIREKILETSVELQAVVHGPVGVARSNATHHTHHLAMQALYRFNLPAHVPLSGEISYQDLSIACGLNEPTLRRILRYLMSCHIFQESGGSNVVHNGPSKAIATVEELYQWIGMVCEDLWPAATYSVDALEKWPGSEEPNQTGFSIANNSTESMFKTLAQRPERLQRFAKGMSLFAKAPGMEPSHMIRSSVWDGFRSGNKVSFVDMGGSHGTTSIAFARAFPQARCIVQDLPHTIEAAKVPEDLQGRLSFRAHDFFTEQTETNADVYFFRWIFHDWADKYCILILKSLIPALKPGARVIINEFCIPEPGTIPAEKEKMMRSFDLVMLTLQNSKEREASDWEALFAAVDSRFKFTGVTRIERAPLALIEFQWMP